MISMKNILSQQKMIVISRLVAFIIYMSIGIFSINVCAQNEKSQKDWEDFDPNNFDQSSINIDNKWLPLKPGTHFVYEGSANEEGERIAHRIEFTVTDMTKIIMGINTVVAWIVDYADGELVEIEVAFYAQDKVGTVWYFGEHPEAYVDGVLEEAPSWIAGIEDARPGIAMYANPLLGTPSYSQGWAPAVDWTDRAQIYQISQNKCVPVDCYEDVLIIDEFNYKEPGFKQKYYAPGIGEIGVGWRGEEEQQETMELVELSQLILGALTEIRKEAMDLEKHAYEISKDVYGKTEPMVQRSPD